MATGRVESGRSVSPRSARTAIAGLSRGMWHDTMQVMIHWVDAGRSNLMQGYASTIVITDFLHSAGLTTDQAYQAVNLLSSIMDIAGTAETLIGVLFGNGALAPTLRTSLDNSKRASGEEEPESLATTAASTLALAGQIAAAVA